MTNRSEATIGCGREWSEQATERSEVTLLVVSDI